MAKSRYTEDYTIDEPSPLDTYLKNNGYSRYKLSQISGIGYSTIQHVARRKVENMEGKYYIFIGQLIHKKPSVVFDEMMELQSEIDKGLGRL